MLNYEDARALVFQNVKPLEKYTRPLTESLGLALSEDISAPHGIPLFDNSAVDGYAVQATDLAKASNGKPVLLKVLGYISAGDSGEVQMCSGQCFKIATGASLPIGANAVVMMEDIGVEGSHVRFTQSISEKENTSKEGFLDEAKNSYSEIGVVMVDDDDGFLETGSRGNLYLYQCRNL